MHERRRFELASELAVAKSRQDVPAALRLFHPDMVQSGVSTDAARQRLFPAHAGGDAA